MVCTALASRAVEIEAALPFGATARAAATEVVAALKRGRAFAALLDIAADDLAGVALATLASGTVRVQTALIVEFAAGADAFQSFAAFEAGRTGPALTEWIRRRDRHAER